MKHKSKSKPKLKSKPKPKHTKKHKVKHVIEQPKYVEPEPFTKLGHNPEPHQPQGVWEIDVKGSVPHIDPIMYFKTSGDAVIKARRLESDLWKAASAARKFGNLLEKVKDKNKYLETEWISNLGSSNDGVTNGRLVVKTKNPRPNPRLLALHKARQQEGLD